MNERYKAALACLNDAKQHAVAAADYDMAAAINDLLDRFLPKRSERDRLVTALRDLLVNGGVAGNALAQQRAGDLLRELGERE